MINLHNKTNGFIKMINLISKTNYFIKNINLLSKTGLGRSGHDGSQSFGQFGTFQVQKWYFDEMT